MNSNYDSYMCRGLNAFVGSHVSDLFRFGSVVKSGCVVRYSIDTGIITAISPNRCYALLSKKEACLVFNDDGKLINHLKPPAEKISAPIRSAEPKTCFLSYVACAAILIISAALML